MRILLLVRLPSALSFNANGGVVLGKWATISTTYAGGAKGEIVVAILACFSLAFRYFGLEHGTATFRWTC